MSPFRLVVIGILVYVFYRLLTRSGKPTLGKSGKQTAGPDDQAVQDVLVEDPVCHTLVPKGQSIQLHHENQIYYFCSQKCCNTFLSNQKGKQT